MNQSEFYAQWTAALRSGEYEQGRDFLRDGNRFCCLGVACDILSDNGEGEWRPSYKDGSLSHFHINNQSDSGVLPSRVQEYLDMTAAGEFDLHEGMYHDSETDRWISHRTALTELNDDGFTFAQIADVIEYFFAPKVATIDK